MTEDRTLNRADLESFARRVAHAAQSSAELKHKAAIYTSALYHDAIVEEVFAMLKTVVIHERMQAGKPLGDLVPEPLK